MNETDLANLIIEKGFGALDNDLEGQPLKDWKTGNYQAWTKTEYERFQAFLDLANNYLALEKPQRPLCLAVFGPPGSGKSFGVGQIAEVLEKTEGHALTWTEINLTQLKSTEQLAERLEQAATDAGDDKVPLVFVDEFDAPLDGTPLGWLSWFLAPMHDAKLSGKTTTQTLKRALYVFAGGTASTFDEFSGRRDPGFVSAKGPDFVSRLRGYLDVAGPNDPGRTKARRAIIIRKALEDSGKARAKDVELSDALRDDLLAVGRYRHGARSIGAVVELAASSCTDGTLEHAHLPLDHVLRIHVDAGPLDAETIGGLVGISGGGPSDDDLKATWRACATMVWKLGGSLAYGGSWESLTQELRDELNGFAPLLSRDPHPDPRLHIFSRQAPPDDIGKGERETIVAVPSVSQKRAIQQPLDLFALRWMMTSAPIRMCLPS